MISNEVQYRATKAHLAKFHEAIANIDGGSADVAGGPKRRALELGALRSQADDLATEIQEYEALRSGTLTTFEAASLAELVDTLVKVRIARGWSQRQLADALGVAEQQVQRYEATRYASASLARLCDVIDALEVEVTESVTLSTDAA